MKINLVRRELVCDAYYPSLAQTIPPIYCTAASYKRKMPYTQDASTNHAQFIQAYFATFSDYCDYQSVIAS